ncbi:acyltransferase [Frigidibacter sp. RF13]|uniref:acyltransferase family protein n=1 Tax=Frigidibacter sp. RF13 TaxID=2997340 RepID=UPI00226DD1CE|nr:acyltransferase [Frigidibacter sp. RF13]MCY1126471.1 acyltransferase [Frigidibacter sp. RF13]
MTRDESIQIELVRVICITCMMWVHVAPGLATPSFVNGGSGTAAGIFFGETLGRVSVTTLSFVSGYLFWTTGIAKPFPDVARRLAFSILLPMLIWSAIFILMAWLRGRMGEPSNAIALVGEGWMGWVNAWTGLAGRTANQSLFFVRDLIAATLILRLIAPLVRLAPVLSVLIAIGVNFLTHTQPFLFRPQILTFMILGAACAQRGWTVTHLAAPRFSLIWGFGFSIAATTLYHLYPGEAFPFEIAHDLMRRAGIGCLIVAIAYALVENPAARSVANWGRHSFLAYLSHACIIGVLWLPWSRIMGSEQEPPYLLFFLAMPPLCMALAIKAGRLVDRLPPLLQIALRGRIFRDSGRAGRVDCPEGKGMLSDRKS